MKSLNILLATLMLGSGAALAEDCSKPASPELPDGASASMEEMLAGQQAVKAFQTENLEYMDCLEKRFSAAKTAIEEGEVEGKEALKAVQAEYSEAVDAYNKAVSTEEEVAGQFNTEIREYKAANPQ